MTLADESRASSHAGGKTARPEVKEAARFICPSLSGEGRGRLFQKNAALPACEDEKRSAGFEKVSAPKAA